MIVPAVTLADTDANNIVTGSNIVTITATFSEAMAVTPTINITGEVSNVAMTASSTASVWIYPWTGFHHHQWYCIGYCSWYRSLRSTPSQEPLVLLLRLIIPLPQ